MSTYPNHDPGRSSYTILVRSTPASADANSDLRSAIRRLPVAVVAADEHRFLRPLNASAERLFDDEALERDLVASDSAHPIAGLIASIDRGLETAERTLEFRSGKRYRVKASTRSSRDARGWLLLFIEPARRVETEDARFDAWALTRRERDVARQLMAGASSRAICNSACIAANTLRTHIRRLLEKSGAHSRTEFLAKVLG